LREQGGTGTAAQRGCGAPSLEAFKARLDEALGSLFWWKVSISMEGGLEMDYLKFSSFYD